MTTYFECGGHQIALCRFWKLVEPTIVGRRSVLRIWLEEFLGDVKHYVALTGQGLLRAAAAVQGALSLETALTASMQSEAGKRPLARLLSKILNLDR